MSLSGSSDEITANTSLTSNALIKGSDGNTVTSTGILCDDFNRLTGVDEITCGTLNATFDVNGESGGFTILDTERLRLQDGTNDIIMKSPTSTGLTVLKYGPHTETVVHTLPNVTGTVAVSGGSQNVSFGTISGSSITSPTLTSSSSLTLTSASGSNINIDAVGSGVININNLETNGGIRFNTNSGATTPIIICPDADMTKLCMTLGVNLSSGVYRPFIGAQTPGVGWGDLHISPDNTKKTIFGSAFATVVSSANTVFNTSVDCKGAFFIGNSLLSDVSKNITCRDITSSTNSLNGITIPSSGGTLAKTSDIPSPGLNLVVAQILSDGTIFYQAGSRTVSVSVGGTGVYVLTLSSGALIRSCIGSCTASGAMRTLNCEVNGTNSCTVVCRDKVEAGIDSPFNVHITWT